MNKQEESQLVCAIDAIKAGEFSKAKFNESLDVVFNLSVARDSTIRGCVKAPHGLSRKRVVAVFTDQSCPEAEYVIRENEIQNFFDKKLYKKCDICITEKRFLPILAKIGGKKLGTRKLMPDLKVGTVTENVSEAVKTFKEGVIFFRGNKSGSKAQKASTKTEKLIIHATIGNVVQPTEYLKDNFKTLVEAVKQAMPVRGRIASIFLSSTMSRSVNIALGEVA